MKIAQVSDPPELSDEDLARINLECEQLGRAFNNRTRHMDGPPSTERPTVELDQGAVAIDMQRLALRQAMHSVINECARTMVVEQSSDKRMRLQRLIEAVTATLELV